MRRLVPLLLLLCGTFPVMAHAQASQFGIRGLGLPGRSSSARALALGGSFSPFDGESSVNPATLGTLNVVTTLFTSGAAWRSTTNPAGEASLSDTRFPQILVGGPIPSTRMAIGISYSTYTDRDFFTVSKGTASPRGEPVNYIDSLVSLGGINDMRIALSYRRNSRLLFGAGLHFLTGSNRLMGAREWEDPSYLAVSERAELAYFGVGLSAGFLMQPMSGLAFAASIRKDGPLDVRLDSTESISTTIDMPLTFSGGLRGRVKRGVELSGAMMYRNWSKADAGIRKLGAIGAANTLEFSGGVEVTRDPKRPTQFPLRLGARYTDLPFLISPSAQPKEWNLSVGTGFRFSGDHGGLDFSLQRFNRSQGDGYHENGWILNIGASVRSAGARP
jgi:hypothetical protein